MCGTYSSVSDNSRAADVMVMAEHYHHIVNSELHIASHVLSSNFKLWFQLSLISKVVPG